MVRDAYSAGDAQLSNGAEGQNAQGQPLDLRGSADNLTQELAQLLAATIAHGKTGSRTGTPTGSELASLAALVAASQKQRPIAPSFKDGLSSLSYSPSHAAPAAAPAPVQLTEHHDADDEPMPIPSTWRETTPASDDRWFRQQLGAAVLGLAAGLMVVVPAVLWLTGWIGSPQAHSRASTARTAPIERSADVAAAEVRPVRVQVRPVETAEVAAQYIAATVEPRAMVAPGAVEQSGASQAEPVPTSEDLLHQAERRIETGDVVGARQLLAASEGATSGALVFALAETFDSNMLAAWGVRGVTADVTKARSLYFKARDLGIIRAQARLELLK